MSIIYIISGIYFILAFIMSATPAYFIDFRNGTVLSMLSDTGYGSVGTDFFTEFDEDGVMVAFGLENADGPYLYNDGLYDVIQKVTAKY